MSLIQEQKQLTFEDICPTWSQAIQDGKTREFLHIMNPNYCILGGASGWNGKYMGNCSECYQFSAEFPNYFDGWVTDNQFHFYVNDEQKFEVKKAEFVKH